MLQLDVARLKDGTNRLDRVIQPAALPPEEEYRITAPVALDATASRDKGTVRIAGRATTTLELNCSRCVEPFPVPVDATFDLLYLPVADAPADSDEVEVRDEDINTAFYSDGVIDLAELVHEQLYLALPMKPLCRDDCQGLCPVCGVNRNTASCTCEPRWEDPRLAALKALLNEKHDA